MKMRRTQQIALLLTFALAVIVVVILSADKITTNKLRQPQAKAKKQTASKPVLKAAVIKSTAVKSAKKPAVLKPAVTKPTTSKVVKKRTAIKPTKTKSTVSKKAPKHTEKHDDKNTAMKSILSSTTGLKSHVLKLGLNAYHWAAVHGGAHKKYLTIVDFSIPSKEKRMWVVNLDTNKVVMKTLVANGKYSGLYKGTTFSNRHGSKMSSLGVYVTGSPYYGGDGLSLHVRGLQPGVNNHAYSRLIEFHGATYVSPAFARAHGRVGRSWGCFALDKRILPRVVHTIKNGSVVFAYANGHNKDYRPYASA